MTRQEPRVHSVPAAVGDGVRRGRPATHQQEDPGPAHAQALAVATAQDCHGRRLAGWTSWHG